MPSHQGKLITVEGDQRAPHVPTSRSRILVARLSSFGLTEPEICVACDLQLHELRQWYKDELEHGLAITVAKVGVALVKQALKGDVNAQRFYLQSRARWVVPTKVEMTGKDGGPVEMELRRKTVDSILTLVRRVAAKEQGVTPSVSRETGSGAAKPPVH